MTRTRMRLMAVGAASLAALSASPIVGHAANTSVGGTGESEHVYVDENNTLGSSVITANGTWVVTVPGSNDLYAFGCAVAAVGVIASTTIDYCVLYTPGQAHPAPAPLTLPGPAVATAADAEGTVGFTYICWGAHTQPVVGPANYTAGCS